MAGTSSSFSIPSAEARKALAAQGAQAAPIRSRHWSASLPAPRTVWVMVPAGETTEARSRSSTRCSRRATASSTAATPTTRTPSGARSRSKRAASHYIDCGTSGGVWGLREGYSLMIGGDAAAVERLRPIFETLAPAKDKGWGRVGPVGRGPLHQDDPQRHRVRPDAGVCRGLLDHGAQGRPRTSTCTRSPRSGSTAAWCARGCST